MKDDNLTDKQSSALLALNEKLASLLEDTERKAAELIIANKELEFQNIEKEKKAKELLHSNEELKKAQMQLLLVNKELEAFSYSVSHDLRAPLRAVGSYSKMLEEDYFNILDDNGKRLLKIIQQSAVKMGILIDDLLSFSRLGKKELQKSTVDLTELTQRIIDEQYQINPHKATLTLHPLPNVLADATLLENVITNYLSNALKYTSKTDKPVIDISARSVNNEVIFCIRDNGPGFDMKYVSKLFNVFQRLHSESEFEGTGVGLAIAKRIIEKHGGRVWAEGEPEKGAAFYFVLPE